MIYGPVKEWTEEGTNYNIIKVDKFKLTVLKYHLN